MSKQQKVLKESIKHWERMLADPERSEEPTSSECACCAEYVTGRTGDSRCVGCPIYEYSGSILCLDTPYGMAHQSFYDLDTEKFQKYGKLEVDFLKKVLAGIPTPWWKIWS